MKVYLVQEFERHESTVILAVMSNKQDALDWIEALQKINIDDCIWFDYVEFEIDKLPDLKGRYGSP